MLLLLVQWYLAFLLNRSFILIKKGCFFEFNINKFCVRVMLIFILIHTHYLFFSTRNRTTVCLYHLRIARFLENICSILLRKFLSNNSSCYTFILKLALWYTFMRGGIDSIVKNSKRIHLFPKI